MKMTDMKDYKEWADERAAREDYIAQLHKATRLSLLYSFVLRDVVRMVHPGADDLEDVVYSRDYAVTGVKFPDKVVPYLGDEYQRRCAVLRAGLDSDAVAFRIEGVGVVRCLDTTFMAAKPRLSQYIYNAVDSKAALFFTLEMNRAELMQFASSHRDPTGAQLLSDEVSDE